MRIFFLVKLCISFVLFGYLLYFCTIFVPTLIGR
nr:MAG TPA: hypothetical protein [Caudoviricetes sp.]